MRKPRRARTVIIIVAAVVLLSLASINALVQHRISLARQGLASIGDPTPIQEVSTQATNNEGRGEYTAAYTSLVARENHEVEANFTWDDEWFFSDSSTYNQGIARAAIIFSAVANCESSYYQAGSNVPAYMEDLLGQMGFDDVSTASYRYRSEIIDQIANVFTPEGTDTTAYTIASKQITSRETGEKKLLVMVAIRGSYGTEWLSNLRAGVSTGILKSFGYGAQDHEGFSQAALDISNATYDYIASIITEKYPELDLGNVALLLCGHSRGGATANICASYLDDTADAVSKSVLQEDSGRSDILSENLYCYTFATPAVTIEESCHSSLYGNIFNILNPNDIVPRIPLATWGYARYGTDLWLPEYGSDGFDEKWQAVTEAFESAVGCATKADPSDTEDVDQIEADLGEIAPTVADFNSVVNKFKCGVALVNGHDIVRIVQAHSTELYSAWMASTEADDLRTSR